MELGTQILAMGTSLAMLLAVIRLMYRRQLREEYSLLWLLATGGLLALSILGGGLAAAARLLGLGDATSLLTYVAAVFVLLILLFQTAAISALARRNRDLAQRVAILEWHLQRLRLGGVQTDADAD